MTLKNLLLSYSTYHDIYQKAPFPEKECKSYCKQACLIDENINKNQGFFYLCYQEGERTWESALSFSHGEAMARKAYSTHKRHTTMFSPQKLEPPRTATIEQITLKEILKDDKWLDELISRISYLVPFNKEEIRELPEDYALQTIWSFEHHLEAEFLFFDGKEFLYSTHKDASIPSSMSHGYSVVIDDQGNYGLIHNKTILLSGEAEFEWILPCEYYYIANEGVLAEVQKDVPISTEKLKEYPCDIIDLETKQVYAVQNALYGSLGSDSFISVDSDGLLQYVKIDTKEKKIICKSNPYLDIIIIWHNDPKPVQCPNTKLWGYLNKECKEVISPRYTEYTFFKDGYAVPNDEFVIDEKGTVVIEAIYKKVIHYEYDYFFVRNDIGWAVFKKDEIYIDFFDILQKLKELGSRHVDEYEEEDIFYVVLTEAIIQKKRALHSHHIYTLPLKEYVALFDTFMSQKHLREAGLLGHRIKVKKLPEQYEDIIKKEESYNIGWDYPCSASIFDMRVELPIVFTKKDGDSLTLGIMLEDLELVKNK